MTNFFGSTLFDFKQNRHNKPTHKWYYGLVTILLWIVALPFLILQFLGLFMAIELWSGNSKKKRGLTPLELRELKKVFGHSVSYHKIRIRERSRWAKYGAQYTRTPHLGFVFLNTIHFSREIESTVKLAEMAWLVHEVTHVSQYQKYGIVYIIKALRAQRHGGYNYKETWLQTALNDFNFEQQADIAKQYYLNVSRGHKNDRYNNLILEIQKQKFH